MIFDAGGQLHVDSKLELLWTNPDPEASFAGDTKVKLNVNAYSCMYIVSTDAIVCLVITDNTGPYSLYSLGDYGADRRTVNVVDDGLVFDSGMSIGLTWSDNSITLSDNNKACVPLYIYGVSK